MKITTISEIEKFIEYYDQKISLGLDIPYYEEKQYSEFTEICKYNSLENIAFYLNNELKNILKIDPDLDSEKVRIWCQKTGKFYLHHVFYNDIIYQDFIFELNGNYYLTESDIQVKGDDFENLNVFSDLQNILYWENYRLPSNERPLPDPNDYYRRDDVNEGKINRLQEILGILNMA